MFRFTDTEINKMGGNPDVLRALANQHDCSAAQGEAMGFDCAHHESRSKELVKLAEKIEAEI